MVFDNAGNFDRQAITASVGTNDPETISVTDASLLPDPSSAQYNIVIWDAGSYVRPDQDPDVELLRVTGRDTNNDTITCSRGEENTSNTSHPASSEVASTFTAKVLSDIDSVAESLASFSGTPPTADYLTSQLGSSSNRQDVYGDSINVQSVNTTTVYTSVVGGIQAAHDTLPPSGGKIIVDDTIAETGITLSKPTVIEGVGQGDTEQTSDASVIDTSGGDGISIQDGGCTLRDLKIIGDGTGGYGVKQGSAGVETLNTTIDGVSINNKGGVGYLCRGKTIGSRYGLAIRDCGSHGFFVDLQQDASFFNANYSDLLWLASNSGDGVRLSGPANSDIVGNEFRQFVAEDNGGYGIHVLSGNVQRLTFSGYGCEQNASGAVLAETGVPIRLQVKTLGGSVTYNGAFFMAWERYDGTYIYGVKKIGAKGGQGYVYDTTVDFNGAITRNGKGDVTIVCGPVDATYSSKLQLVNGDGQTVELQNEGGELIAYDDAGNNTTLT
jgi:hypothetical protein